MPLISLVLSREWGNEPKDSLKGNHKKWFIGVIPFPTEHRQVILLRRLCRGRVARHEGLALGVAEDAALTTAALGQQAARREDSCGADTSPMVYTSFHRFLSKKPYLWFRKQRHPIPACTRIAWILSLWPSCALAMQWLRPKKTTRIRLPKLLRVRCLSPLP